MKRFSHILCVVDTDGGSKTALERAVALAEQNKAQLMVVEVVDRVTAGIGLQPGGPFSSDIQVSLEKARLQALDKLVEPYHDRATIETRLLVGTPFLVIIREVMGNGFDLVVKAPDDLSWLDRLFSSDDMHLLRKCPCPVWLIKPNAPLAYRRILAAVDVSDAYPPDELASRHALNRQILEIASSLALADFAELHVMHAWEAVGENAMRGAFMNASDASINAYVEGARQSRKESLNVLMQQMSDSLNAGTMSFLKPQIHLIKGRARKEVPALATQLKVDIIVMGTVGRTGIPGFIMGNTAETILNQIDCSVLAIKPPGFVTPVTLEE